MAQSKPAQLVYISTIEGVPYIAESMGSSSQVSSSKLFTEAMLPQIADQGSQSTDGSAAATVTVDNIRAELSLIDSAWSSLDSATSTFPEVLRD